VTLSFIFFTRASTSVTIFMAWLMKGLIPSEFHLSVSIPA
jgi:hypothetical protein